MFESNSTALLFLPVFLFHYYCLFLIFLNIFFRSFVHLNRFKLCTTAIGILLAVIADKWIIRAWSWFSIFSIHFVRCDLIWTESVWVYFVIDMIGMWIIIIMLLNRICTYMYVMYVEYVCIVGWKMDDQPIIIIISVCVCVWIVKRFKYKITCHECIRTAHTQKNIIDLKLKFFLSTSIGHFGPRYGCCWCCILCKKK